MKIAYYPGCEATIIATEANDATKKVLEKVGVELVELENAGCCGSMELRVKNFEAMLALNGRILALAEETEAYKLLTICNTCALNLETATARYNNNEAELRKLNDVLSLYNREYHGTTEVITLPWLLIRLVGFSAMRRAAVEKPLKGLKIAPFYGCHMMRPSKYLGFESSLKPSSLDIMIDEFFDGQTVHYHGESLCCGFHTLLTEEKTSTSMIGQHLGNAIKAGADCVVTPCTQCMVALDTYQKRALGGNEIPILHLSQLVGLAFGIPTKKLALKRHMVDPSEMLASRGFA